MNELGPHARGMHRRFGVPRGLLAIAAVCALIPFLACSDGAKKKFVASSAGGGSSQQGVATLSALFAGAQFAPGQPAIGVVAPADGEQGVPLTAPVVVIFSESVDPKTVTPTSITLTRLGSSFGGGFGGQTPVPVPAALALDPSTANRAAVLLPTQKLEPNSQYLIQVSTAIRDLEGEALTVPGGTSGNSGSLFGGATGASVREFRFTTVSAATPVFRLMTMFPEPSAKNVASSSPVILYFSDTVALNGPSGLKTGDNLRLSALGQKLDGTIAAALDPRIVVFTPKKPFSPGAQVSVRINNTVANGDGVQLASAQPIENSFTVSNIRMPTAITFPANAPFTFAGTNFAGTMTLDNIDQFRASVTIGGTGATPDSITLLYFQDKQAGKPAARVFTKDAASGSTTFKNDMTKGSGEAVFKDSNSTAPPSGILVGAYCTRNGQNSPVGPLGGLPQVFKKTTEPTVVLGPPTDDADPFTVRTVVRLPALYGSSSETLTAFKAFIDTDATPSTLDAIALSAGAGITDDDGRLVTSTYDGQAATNALRFVPTTISELRYTDSIGNQFKKRVPKAGAIHHEGSIGGPLEAGAGEVLRVRVVADHTLKPLKGTRIAIEAYPHDPLGAPAVARKTNGKGEAKFTPGDLGAFGTRLLVTVERDDFDVFTFAACRNPANVGTPYGLSVLLHRTGRVDPVLTVKTKNDIVAALGSFAATAANVGTPTSPGFFADPRFATFAPLGANGTNVDLSVEYGRPFVVGTMEAANFGGSPNGRDTFTFLADGVRALEKNAAQTFDFAVPGGQMQFSTRFANSIVPVADLVTAGITTGADLATRSRLIARVPGLPGVLPLSFGPTTFADPGQNFVLLFSPIPSTLDQNETSTTTSAGDPIHELMLQPSAVFGTDALDANALTAATRLEIEASDLSTTKRTRFRARLDYTQGGSVPTSEAIQLLTVPIVQIAPATTSHPPVLNPLTDAVHADAMLRITLKSPTHARRWVTLIAGDELESLPGDPTLKLPKITAKPFQAAGTYEGVFEVFEFDPGTFDANAFQFEEIDGLHRRHARSATTTLTTVP